MENCLVTKLKGTVVNENLIPLGKIRLYLKSNSDDHTTAGGPNWFDAGASDNPLVSVANAKLYDSSGNELTQPTPLNWIRHIVPQEPSRECYVDIPKYTIEALVSYSLIGIVGFDKYASNLSNIQLKGATEKGLVDADALVSCPMTYIVLDENIQTTRKLTTLELSQHLDIDTLRVQSTAVDGTIMDFVNNIKLNQLYFNRSAVTGVIENLLAGQFAAGRRSSSLRIGVGQSELFTFNGVVYHTCTWLCRFSDEGITVTNDLYQSVGGTYDGSSWTFTS